MVKRHVAPKIRFGCATVGFNDKIVKDLELMIERTVLSSIGMGRSPALAWILRLGVEVSPSFWRDFECIQTRRRTLRRLA